MADPVAPTAEQLEEVVKEAPKLALNSRIPLQQQAGKIAKFMESTADKEEEKPKEDEKKPDEKPVEDTAKEETEQVVTEEEDEEVPPEQKSVELEPVAQYILKHLPTLTVRVKDGEGTKVLQYKDTSDLPADFEIATDADRAKFTSDVAMQTQRARDALNDYKQEELKKNIQQFEAQQAQDVADDVAYLQKRGILPEFQYKEDDPKFNSDPAVKLANEIYDLFEKINKQYAQKYANTGRTYRISYRDAADKYFARQSRTKVNEDQKAAEQPAKPESKKTPKATEERQQVARQQGAPQGGEASGNKFRPKKGMKLSDINRLVSQGKI
jgi:hypothetical protein